VTWSLPERGCLDPVGEFVGRFPRIPECRRVELRQDVSGAWGHVVRSQLVGLSPYGFGDLLVIRRQIYRDRVSPVVEDHVVIVLLAQGDMLVNMST